MSEAAQLVALVRSNAWLMDVLAAVRQVDPPQWWVGGGVLRDLVWDTQAGGFDPTRVSDVDVAFFDAGEVSRARDDRVEAALRSLRPDVAWDAKNQAAVHTWYAAKFGYDVPPLRSTVDGVTTWPETATAVAVRFGSDGALRVVAVPGGVRDLLAGVCRRNPRRVSVAEYHRRLRRKNVTERWPHVTVIP